jgi:hypothetical protein
MAQGWRARNRVPGLRPHYHAHYYGAFVLDPDGHRIEAVCHTPMSPAIVATGLRRAERNPSSDIRHTSSRAADTVLPRARLHHAAGAHRGTSRPNALGSGAPVRLAAGNSTTPDRDTYTQKARDEMQEWRRKLHDFSERAAAKGKEAGNAAENDLNKTWTKADAASRKLHTVGAEGWGSAKTSFEKASHELADAWHRIRPRDK